MQWPKFVFIRTQKRLFGLTSLSKDSLWLVVDKRVQCWIQAFDAIEM